MSTTLAVVITSIVTALLSGALVAFLNSILQQMKDEKTLYRVKAETIFNAMNRIIAYHSIMGSDLNDIADQEGAQKFLDTYKLYGPMCRDVFSEDVIINTEVSIYFRDCLEEQGKVSHAVKDLWFQALDDAKMMKGLERSELSQKREQLSNDLDARYHREFNATADVLSKKLLQSLDRIELDNSSIWRRCDLLNSIWPMIAF